MELRVYVWACSCAGPEAAAKRKLGHDEWDRKRRFFSGGAQVAYMCTYKRRNVYFYEDMWLATVCMCQLIIGHEVFVHREHYLC